MAKPDPTPETYLNLSAPTQFELAQRIDAALLAAENAVSVSQETQCFQLWLQEFYDLANEEFNASIDVLHIDQSATRGQIKTAFQQALKTLILVATQSDPHSNAAMKSAVSLLLERSFLDALDFMHGQGSWRFDIQRAMQGICKELQVYIDNFSS